jgi:hypothetical protein
MPDSKKAAQEAIKVLEKAMYKYRAEATSLETGSRRKELVKRYMKYIRTDVLKKAVEAYKLHGGVDDETTPYEESLECVSDASDLMYFHLDAELWGLKNRG